MKIETLQQQGLEATRYMERYVNNVKPGTHSDWSETNIDYSPHEGISEFPVPVFGIKPEEATILLSNPDRNLIREVIGKDVVRFFVHPDMANDPKYLDIAGIDPDSRLDEIYMVTPTASTRTLLTKDRKSNFMIKTDLDRKHYRFIRRLKGSSVDHSIRISRELERVAREDDASEYAFLPESLGVVLNDGEDGAGVLFREVVPRPFASDARVLIPYFSLYADDLKNPDDLPLLIQLVRKNADAGGEMQFLTDQILGKIVRNWTHFATQYGLLLELHGQNTMLEIDESFRPQRIVHRDFQSIYVDRQIRERNGLDLPFRKHIVGEEAGTDRPRQFSIVYDHQVGDYLFDRLINTFRRYYPEYSYKDISSRVSQIFRQGFPDWREVFPEETYTYGQQIGNEVNLVPKHLEPIFR